MATITHRDAVACRHLLGSEVFAGGLWLKIAHCDGNRVWVNSETTELGQTIGREDVRLIHRHAEEFRNLTITDCFGTTVVEGLSNTRRGEQTGVDFAIRDERQAIGRDIALHKCFAECADLGDRVVCTSGRENSSTKVGNRDCAPDVGEDDTSEGFAGLDGEVVHHGSTAVGNLHIGKVDRGDAVFIHRHGGECDRAAASFVAVVEGRRSDSADKRNNNSITFATSLVREVFGKCVERGELRHKRLHGDLGEDFIVKGNGSHGNSVVVD